VIPRQNWKFKIITIEKEYEKIVWFERDHF
jgi:hypothetical protein